MIYSKGVLTHLETKDELFRECHRLLKRGGLLVITDWLSSEDKKWGENIARLVELEHLALFPESTAGYIEALEKEGFTVLICSDESPLYLRFNRQIVEGLQDPKRQDTLLKAFTATEREDAVVGYESIAEAIETGELRVFHFIAQKNLGG